MNPLRWLTSFFRNQQQNPPAPTESFYGLDHALLNITLPPPSMWMNLGYWKDTTSFPTACAALLDQVLITAGLLSPDGGPLSHPNTKTLRMLDVGIGCGDQSVRILGYARRTDDKNDNGDVDVGGDGLRPLCDEYVGITSLPVQARFAGERVRRVQEEQFESEEKGMSKDSSPTATAKTDTRARIFCADAAKPNSWSQEIHTSLESYTRASTKPEEEEDTSPTQDTGEKQEEDPRKQAGEANDREEEETYLLALDTLYHFTPSRLPLLRYANRTLHANLMAFDILLPSRPLPLLTRLLLRLLCLFTSTPYSNFLTESEYRSLLLEAGYDGSKIEFRDISEHVFPGVAAFMRRRVEEARMFGIKGVGKYKGAGVVFRWWATGVVRGVVVVARV
ncbi:hypothetical protein BJX68DRAFT_249608 [Aspergillus pseudodeflectus]|uniref:S-adenosyl-L-methionine-dependent methyltransferase n=1 Tax=Aspergillus pseudodeflectus TaxID=176178 RepID=A0ABR4JEW6_9EURO